MVAYLIGQNRLNPVRLPKLWRQRQVLLTQPPEPLTNLRHPRDLALFLEGFGIEPSHTNLRHPRDLARGEGEGWVVGSGHDQMRRISEMPLPRSLDSPGLMKSSSGWPSNLMRLA